MLLVNRISLYLSFVTLALSGPSCRCLFGDECWPRPADFSILSSKLSSPLISPRPPESACYPTTNPSGNCSDVTSNALDGRWRSDQSGSMQAPNFETFMFTNGTIDACYLNTTSSAACGQGSVPPIGVDARSIADVQAAVGFAVEHNLRFVIKNTGHDFLGRSTARGAFLLWTHHMKNISYTEDFVPVGAPANVSYKALTLGAGVQWHEAYDAAEANGRFIVGGLSSGASVGAAGGWVMGGGHSAFSARHGLGVDNVVQFEVVTANSEHLFVNAYKNADLFWALRGGGGGTYAIVVSATYRTHETFPLTGVFFTGNFTSADVAQNITTEYIKIHPTLADNGWGGYSSMGNSNLSFFYVAPNVSVADANVTIDPFFSLARLSIPDLQASLVPFDSFYQWYQMSYGTGAGSQVGTNLELGSRLIPRDSMEHNPGDVAKAVLAVEGAAMNFVAGGAVSKVNPDSVGLNPAWRRAVGQIGVDYTWPDGASTSQIDEVRMKIRNNVDILNKVTPESGAYFNEASLYERDPRKTFFGSHYPKLKAIKNKYDGHGLFVVASGVGSEDWDGSLNCRLH